MKTHVPVELTPSVKLNGEEEYFKGASAHKCAIVHVSEMQSICRFQAYTVNNYAILLLAALAST